MVCVYGKQTHNPTVHCLYHGGFDRHNQQDTQWLHDVVRYWIDHGWDLTIIFTHEKET